MKNVGIGVALFMVLFAIFVLMKACGAGGMLFDTVVERKVFENSYQYQQGKSEQINILEAQKAELESQLIGNLTGEERTNIESQLRAISIRLNAARRDVR